MILNMTGGGSGGIWYRYSGSYEQSGDETHEYIWILTSGTLTALSTKTIDLFLVGGGGGSMFGGSGAGYTFTARDIPITAGADIPVIVGAGGTAGYCSDVALITPPGDGGITSFGAFSVLGGKSSFITFANRRNGTDGSSGGGGYSSAATLGHGGVDGSDGQGGYPIGGPYAGNGGIGQHTTTRAFGEPNGELFATGGRGGYEAQQNSSGLAGAPNTGDGASGGRGGSGVGVWYGANGGSGIIILRWQK